MLPDLVFSILIPERIHPFGYTGSGSDTGNGRLSRSCLIRHSTGARSLKGVFAMSAARRSASLGDGFLPSNPPKIFGRYHRYVITQRGDTIFSGCMVRYDAATPASSDWQRIAPPAWGGLDDTVAGSQALPFKSGIHDV